MKKVLFLTSIIFTSLSMSADREKKDYGLAVEKGINIEPGKWYFLYSIYDSHMKRLMNNFRVLSIEQRRFCNIKQKLFITEDYYVVPMYMKVNDVKDVQQICQYCQRFDTVSFALTYMGKQSQKQSKL